MFTIAVNLQNTESDKLSIESDDASGRALIADFRKQVGQFVSDGPVDSTRLNAEEIGAIVQYLPEKKIMAIKECRNITGSGLKEAKEYVEKIMKVGNMNNRRDEKAELIETNRLLQIQTDMLTSENNTLTVANDRLRKEQESKSVLEKWDISEISEENNARRR